MLSRRDGWDRILCGFENCSPFRRAAGVLAVTAALLIGCGGDVNNAERALRINDEPNADRPGLRSIQLPSAARFVYVLIDKQYNQSTFRVYYDLD